MTLWRRAALPSALLMALPGVVFARTLEVGPGRTYDRPSAATSAVQEGDTVTISPGVYFDCAIWRTDHVTIIGEQGGDGVMITDASCGGKAAFIISGNDVTVRNLGFARIRVPDDNGAGIRGEGRDLTVEDSRFVNTQMGILATSPSGGVLRILGCRFSEVGSSLIGRINFAVRASGFDVVRIEHSVFDEASGGGHISVDGARTELVGNRLVDEGGHMAGPMVSLQGGALLLEGNTVEVAKGAAMRPGVVLATGNDVRALMVRDNIFRDALGGTPLVRNWTGQDGVATGNTVPAGTEVVSNAGVIYYRLRVVANDFRDSLRELWREARHLAGALLRRLG